MSNNPVTIEAQARTEHGKGAARRARAGGHVPAVVYARGKPTISVVVGPKELAKALTGNLKRNILINLDVAGGDKRTVMVKAMQSHPVKRVPTHVDFIEVTPDQRVPVKVPLEVTGKSKAIGQGAKLTLICRTITIECVAKEVPEKIGYDVTEEGFGVVRAKQIKLPAGTTLVDPPETPLISLKIPRGDKEEEAAAAAAVPGAEGAAAPTADGKAAPAAAAGKDAKGAAPVADAAKDDKKKK